MRKIMPCLWFDKEAEEAARFYVSVFKRSRVREITRYGKAGREVHGGKEGRVLTVVFELEGQRFMALNGGPHFKFSPAVSLVVDVKTQKELDGLWRKLSAVKAAEQCGWLQDKFGLSWQIVPSVVGKMMADEDVSRRDRVMSAILGMHKLDIAALKAAYRS